MKVQVNLLPFLSSWLSYLMNVTIYTDGGCRPNPGRGAWASVLVRDGKETILKGMEAESTSNRMEITAVIQTLQYTLPNDTIQIYTDSTYVYNSIRNMAKWLKKKDLPNKDLVVLLNEQLTNRTVTCTWVPREANERCNHLVEELFWGSSVPGDCVVKVPTDTRELREVHTLREGTQP